VYFEKPLIYLLITCRALNKPKSSVLCFYQTLRDPTITYSSYFTPFIKMNWNTINPKLILKHLILNTDAEHVSNQWLKIRWALKIADI